MKEIKPLKDFLEGMKKIEGYPIGKDEDILKLSDPPHYTACPNPYIKDFIKEHGKTYDEKTDSYHREPFAGDVAEGKRHPYYMMHTYHTKVPHQAIVKYIKHFTEPGDLVLDTYCGSGMTGLASTISGRNSIILDLSPAATFLAYNNVYIHQNNSYLSNFLIVLNTVENELRHLYQVDEKLINYIVWSETFICPYCKNVISFWDTFVNPETEEISNNSSCPHCDAMVNKKILLRNTPPKYEPVMASIIINKKKRKVRLTENEKKDLLIKENEIISSWYPMDLLPEGYNLSQPKKSHNFKNVNDFYFNRTLHIISRLWEEARFQDKNVLNHLKYIITSILSMRCTKRMPYRPKGLSAGTVNNLSIPSLIQDYNPFEVLKRKHNKTFLKASQISKLENFDGKSIISTQSATDLSNITENSIDFIFTDPPFGKNIMYSDMNFIWESWLKVVTNTKPEAIVNNYQFKSDYDYKDLMIKAFTEYFNVLKPNRWIMVEFNNSKSKIWNILQDSITKSGFIIAQVSILDKKMGSFKQVTSVNTTKNDLIISAYKPKKKFEINFLKSVGEGFEAEFVKMHLDHQPQEPTIERTEKMLYSKMLAYYIQRGYEIAMDSKQFYQMLRDNFVMEDNFWFNREQLRSYREYKMKMKLDGLELESGGFLAMFVVDEKSAITWLYQYITQPMEFSEIHTAYTKVLQKASEDDTPDLREILEANFVFENGKYRIPATDDEKLNLTEKRERALMREFESVLLEAKASRKKIKAIRKEAISHGFNVCYRTGRFGDIIAIAKKLKPSILENDSELNEFVEVAEMKMEGF